MAESGKTAASLEELAVPFSQEFCAHNKQFDAQSTSAGGRFLDACRHLNAGRINEDELISTRLEQWTSVSVTFHRRAASLGPKGIIGLVMTDQPEQQDADRWVREFERNRTRYEALREVVERDLETVLRRHPDLWERVHEMRSRAKTKESFRGKIERKNYPNPMNDMHDLVGLRIVCHYPSIVREIEKLICDTFDVISREDKASQAEPEHWRYSSIHYDCRIPASNSGPQYDGIKDMIFEVQVRTILQDAWATVEHKLGYKNEKSIPNNLKREFSALAGLFHIADERFQHIADEAENSERDAKGEVAKLVDRYKSALELVQAGTATKGEAWGEEWRGESEIIINRGTLRALLKGIYPNRLRLKPYQYSVFVQELAEAEIVDLASLLNLLVRGNLEALELEDRRSNSRPERQLSDIDFARSVLLIASPEFSETHRKRPEKPTRA